MPTLNIKSTQQAIKVGCYVCHTTNGQPSPSKWECRRFSSATEGKANSGLATSLAATHFAMFPLAAVPGAIFSTWHNFSGSIAASVFRKLNKA